MTEEEVLSALTLVEQPLLVTHRHADRDSIGSALGLAALLDSSATLYTPDGVAAPAQPLLEDSKATTNPDPSAHDAMVVLDAPSAERIAPAEPFDESLILVDHHTPGDLSERATASFVDETARSTAELVYRLATTAGWSISKAVAYPLVVGILDDTGFLQAAGPEQIRYVCELLPHIEGREADLATLFEPSPQPGERMARFKATARASFYRAGDLTLAVSHVGGFETAAAHALRDVGADCALIWSEQGDHVRVVGRCSGAFADHVSLGDELLPDLGDRYGGYGGGHHAAGVGRLDLESGDSLNPTEVIKQTVEDHLGMQLNSID